MIFKSKPSKNKNNRNNVDDSLFQNYNHPKGKKDDSNNSILINKLSEKIKSDNKYTNNNMFSFLDRSTKVDTTNNNYLFENSFQQQDSILNNNSKQGKLKNVNNSSLKMSHYKEKKSNQVTKNKEIENSMQEDSLFSDEDVIEENSEENKADVTDEVQKSLPEKSEVHIVNITTQNLDDTVYLFNKAFSLQPKIYSAPKEEKVNSNHVNDYAKGMMDFLDELN